MATSEYDFALSFRRERGVRTGTFQPINDIERRQAEEGDVPLRQYDCAREPSTKLVDPR